MTDDSRRAHFVPHGRRTSVTGHLHVLAEMASEIDPEEGGNLSACVRGRRAAPSVPRSGALAATLCGGLRPGSRRVHDPCKEGGHGSRLGFPGRRPPGVPRRFRQCRSGPASAVAVAGPRPPSRSGSPSRDLGQTSFRLPQDLIPSPTRPVDRRFPPHLSGLLTVIGLRSSNRGHNLTLRGPIVSFEKADGQRAGGVETRCIGSIRVAMQLS